MRDGDILMLNGPDGSSYLDGRRRDIIDKVRMAYEAHGRAETSAPPSSFLRVPDSGRIESSRCRHTWAAPTR